MTDTNKFIALLMAQDDVDFAEEFSQFSEEDQNSFIDFFAYLIGAVMRELKQLPIDMKVMVINNAIGMIPKEDLQELSDAMINIVLDE